MTIKEIAEIAGVSASTVSKIMNHKDESISAETRERVLQIVKEYHYSPYTAAASSKKTMVLGLLLRCDASARLAVSGIIPCAQENGYSIILRNSLSNPEQEYKNISALCTTHVDAVIWEPLSKHSLKYAHCFDENQIPYITIGPEAQNPSICIPYDRVGCHLTEELISRKHQQIACLLGGRAWDKQFVTGYSQCLLKHKILPDEALIFHEINDLLLYKINTRQITGVVISDTVLAKEFCQRLMDLHYKIPEDISVLTLRHKEDLLPSAPQVSACIVQDSLYGRNLCRYLIALIEKQNQVISVFNQKLKLDSEATISTPRNYSVSKILVVGSINIDTYLDVSSLPREGMAVSTNTSIVHPGGKALNQAVGAALLGHRVSIIGNCGFDLQSDLVYDVLHQHGIDTSGVRRCHDIDTGKAYIFVDASGNSIVSILAGANSVLFPEDIHSYESLFEDTSYCLIQSEVPMATVLEACRMAHRHHIQTIVKPSACTQFPWEIFQEIDILCPNEDELKALCPDRDTLRERVDFLMESGVKTVITTLGEKGCFVKTAEEEHFFPAAEFTAVDSTGASDGFISALASYLLDGYPLLKAVQIAIFAAGFVVSRKGVVSAMIDKSSLESYICQKHPELLNT